MVLYQLLYRNKALLYINISSHRTFLYLYVSVSFLYLFVYRTYFEGPLIISYILFLQTYFDVPGGVDPIAIDLSSMGKGQVWVNGHQIGRYWTLYAPKDGCQTCDYRGAYDSNKCLTNCGEPTQSW